MPRDPSKAAQRRLEEFLLAQAPSLSSFRDAAFRELLADRIDPDRDPDLDLDAPTDDPTERTTT